MKECQQTTPRLPIQMIALQAKEEITVRRSETLALREYASEPAGWQVAPATAELIEKYMHGREVPRAPSQTSSRSALASAMANEQGWSLCREQSWPNNAIPQRIAI